LILDFTFTSSNAFLNSLATHAQKELIFIRNVFEEISFVSIIFTMIFSLTILNSSSSQFLIISSFTLVQAIHLIQEVTSDKVLFFETSFSSTFMMISQAFNHVFSAGLQGIGFTILGCQGAASSM
jgi:hypothetical protein